MKLFIFLALSFFLAKVALAENGAGMGCPPAEFPSCASGEYLSVEKDARGCNLASCVGHEAQSEATAEESAMGEPHS